jgi:surfactin synthase thioesterase subunit
MEQVVGEVIRLLGEGREQPFALFGHSFGALVGYETSRRLRQLGTPPELLLVSGRNSPAWPLSHEPLHTLPDASFAAGLNDRRVTTERQSRSPGGLHAVSAAAAHHLARRAVPLEEFANALYERVRLR